jgi:hypothetical protein
MGFLRDLLSIFGWHQVIKDISKHRKNNNQQNPPYHDWTVDNAADDLDRDDLDDLDIYILKQKELEEMEELDEIEEFEMLDEMDELDEMDDLY